MSKSDNHTPAADPAMAMTRDSTHRSAWMRARPAPSAIFTAVSRPSEMARTAERPAMLAATIYSSSEAAAPVAAKIGADDPTICSLNAEAASVWPPGTLGWFAARRVDNNAR